MKRISLTLAAALMFGVPVLTGCERTVSEETTVEKKPDGTVVTEQEKVTRESDGTIERTERREVDPG
jgi:hypothetical protein